MSQEYINKIKDGAIKGWVEYKILPSLTIAQGCLESGWGTSKLSLPPYNNNFGIKTSDDWKGQTVVMNTQEWNGSTMITVPQTFRAYQDINDSVVDHAQFFSSTEWRKNNYRFVIGEKDYLKACYAVKKAGYATDPNYDSKLIKIINDYNLTQYDEIAFQQTGNNVVESNQGGRKVAKHLVICGHGQGRTSYDPGAVNADKGYKEATEVRELAKLMQRMSTNIDYITDKNIYDYGTLAQVSKGYDSVTELHFNAFNRSAHGTEILIYGDYTEDEMDRRILGVLSKYFKNRGYKKVYNIQNAVMAHLHGINYRLVETCFIDNNSDMEVYMNNRGNIARELVEAIEGKVVTVQELNEQSTSQSKTSEHVVVKGDTLWRISSKYGTTVDKLKQLNGLTSDIISIGQKLIVDGEISTPPPTTQSTTKSENTQAVDKLLEWFESRIGRVQYSMDLNLRKGDNYYDCSSAVYSALWYAGFKTRVSYHGNTETLFKENGYLFKEISRNEIKRGDIFIAGREGYSLGEFGHTGVVYSSNEIIHCTYPRNGIVVTPISGWTGSPVRWFRIVGINDSKETEASTTTSTNEVVYNGNELLKLPSYADTWRVYQLGGTYKVGTEIGFLLPSKFGGLEYDILGWVQTNVAKIKTETFGEVAIYVGSETGAQIVKKSSLDKRIVDKDTRIVDNFKETTYKVKLAFIKGTKATIAHFADRYESGRKISDQNKNKTYTILGNKKVNIRNSSISYRIKEVNDWVLEEDIVEAYGDNFITFDYNKKVYPYEFGKIALGQNVVIRPNAETFLNKKEILEEYKGVEYRVMDIMKIEVSYSRYAYKLVGLDEYVLEQDIIQAWECARPMIITDKKENEDIVKKHDIEVVRFDSNDFIQSIWVGVDGEPCVVQYTVGQKEYKTYGIVGHIQGINAIKLNLPKGYEYRVKHSEIGWTQWTHNAFSGARSGKILDLEIQETF